MTEGLAGGVRRWVAEERGRGRLSIEDLVRAWGVPRAEVLSMLGGASDITTDDISRLACALRLDVFDLIALVGDRSFPAGTQETTAPGE